MQQSFSLRQATHHPSIATPIFLSWLSPELVLHVGRAPDRRSTSMSHLFGMNGASVKQTALSVDPGLKL